MGTLIGERVWAVLVVPGAVFPVLDERHPLPTCAPTEISIHCVGVSGPSNAAVLRYKRLVQWSPESRAQRSPNMIVYNVTYETD